MPTLANSYIFSQHSFITLFGGGAAWCKMSRLCCISFFWQCSRKCGSGLRKRTVLCTSTKPGVETRTLPDSLCAGLPKPGSQESCFIKRCQKLRKVQWFVSTWQEVCVKKKKTVRNKHYSKSTSDVWILCNIIRISSSSVQRHAAVVIKHASSSVRRRYVCHYLNCVYS